MKSTVDDRCGRIGCEGLDMQTDAIRYIDGVLAKAA